MIYIKFVSVFCLTFATHFINQRFSTSLLPIMDILKTFLSAICSKIYFFIPFLFQFLFFLIHHPHPHLHLHLPLPLRPPLPLPPSPISHSRAEASFEICPEDHSGASSDYIVCIVCIVFSISMTNFKYFASVLHNGQDS